MFQIISPNGIDQDALARWIALQSAATVEMKADLDSTIVTLHAVLGKLDTDGGVTDANYQSIYGVGGSTTPLPDPSSFTLPSASEDTVKNTTRPTAM